MRITHAIAIGILSVLSLVPVGEASQGIKSRGTSAHRAPSLEPVKMQCELSDNPLGIQSARPHLSWVLESINPERRGLWQTAYQILVATSFELLSEDRGDYWDTGKVQSPQHIQIEYNGTALSSHRVYYWKVRVWDQNNAISRWSEAANWTTGLVHPEEWIAKWIAAPPDLSRGSQPLPMFRRYFELVDSPRQAVVYVSGLGHYELRINGQKVSDDVFSPGWTNYRKTVLYNSYDVRKLLKKGPNVIGVMLGNGMYNIPTDPDRYAIFRTSFGPPKLILQLHVEDESGHATVLPTDASWKTRLWPITFSSIYGGEDYDARREQAGWDTAEFDDTAWFNAVQVDGPGGQLVPQLMKPIKAMHEYEPVRVTEPTPGILVYDLGQNFAGWPSITVSGKPGDRIRLTPGELLDSSGLVSQKSAGGGPTYFSYTLKGIGQESWHPHFSYYGFRYVQVLGAATALDSSSDRPRLLVLKGQSVHSSAAPVGEFSTSDELLNRIHGLIRAAITSNMQSLFTDCPHREKLGWLEETHLMGPAIMYDYDVNQIYDKIADDMRDSQEANALVPDFVPAYAVFEGPLHDSPEWGSAVVLDPWIAYQHYGDLRIFAKHYDTMRAYVDYLSSRADGHIIDYGLGDWFDLGPAPPGEAQLTSIALTATAIYYQDLLVLAEVALLMGRNTDAKTYTELAQEVRAAFNARFLNESMNQYDRGSQTANAIPWLLGLTPETSRKAVLQNLIQDIRNHGNHTTAGDIGFGYVVRTLTAAGRSDVLYDMFSRTDAPSYGYQLAQGATTLTESWDADPSSSQNHFMLGHGENWFYSGLAGINFDLSRPYAEQIEIRPTVVPGITAVEARYDSVLGAITSDWNIEENIFILDVSIPPGANATVVIPATNVTESGHELENAEGVHIFKTGNRNAIVQIASGHYRFRGKPTVSIAK